MNIINNYEFSLLKVRGCYIPLIFHGSFRLNPSDKSLLGVMHDAIVHEEIRISGSLCQDIFSLSSPIFNGYFHKEGDLWIPEDSALADLGEMLYMIPSY